MLDNHTPPHISYAQLREVLNSFGFEQRVTSTYTAFREGAHDAIIMLPLMANSDIVSDAHLITIVNTIVGKGVASEESLASRLQEATWRDMKAPRNNTQFTAAPAASKTLTDGRMISASKSMAASALSMAHPTKKDVTAQAGKSNAKKPKKN